MKLPDDYEEHSGMSMSTFSAIVAVTLFIALIFVVVIVWNLRDVGNSSGNKTPTEPGSQMTQESMETDYPDTDQLISGSSLTPDDLDFWDQYPESAESSEPVEESSETSEEPEKPDLEDEMSDGYRTLITYPDGSEEWVAINSSIPANTYELTNLIRHGNMMKYFVGDKQVSYVGVRISEESDYVDFTDLKKAGVDFCMIRVGARGYSTGQLVVDDNFKDNIKGATDAGLDVGVYFFSQAVSEEEARAEAALVLEQIREYDVDYPIAFDMEYILNDDSRIDELSRNDKTKIARAFLQDIETAGYKPILYGSKAWLIQEINLLKLEGYDVWLGEPGDIPDYPYQFMMWEYSDSAKIDGISGYANMSISFIDYSEK